MKLNCRGVCQSAELMKVFRLAETVQHKLAQIPFWYLTARTRAMGNFKLSVTAGLVSDVWRANSDPFELRVLWRLNRSEHSKMVGSNLGEADRNSLRVKEEKTFPELNKKIYNVPILRQ